MHNHYQNEFQQPLLGSISDWSLVTNTGTGLINTPAAQKYSRVPTRQGVGSMVPTIFCVPHPRKFFLTFSHEVRDTEPSLQDSLPKYRQSWSIKR